MSHYGRRDVAADLANGQQIQGESAIPQSGAGVLHLKN
jgi:hypothetical protein